MEYIHERDYNNGQILQQVKKEKFICLITRDSYTGEFVLWKSNTKKEVARSRDALELQARIAKYK